MRRAIVFFAASAVLYAQAPMSLTLADAERLALQNNPQISSAQNLAAAANQVPIEYRANLLPSLSGAITGVGADNGSRIAAGALNNPVVYDRFGTGVVVNQLLTDFGRTHELIDSVKLRAQAQQKTVETTQDRILLTAVRAYYTLLRAHSVLTVAQQTVTARQLIVDQVTALFQASLKSQLDVSFANVNLSDARLLLSQAENALKSSEADLANALALPSQTSFVVQDDPMPGALPIDVGPLVETALQTRTELQDLRLQQTSAEHFAKAEHALIYPTLSATGVAGVVPAGVSAVPGRYGAVGVNLNIPIFNGGLYRARQNEAELKAKAASDLVADLSNRISRDVRVSYLNAQTAFDRVGLTDQLLQEAQQALDLAQGRYDLGLSSIIELSQAQLNLTSAQIANASARYEYQAERADLDYQTGALH